MKFSLSWLKTHLRTEASLVEITDTLTRIGLELEGVVDRGAALAAFRVAAVLEAVQHPNADRLRACRVDTGDGIVSVVCGAPNARAGMRAVFAPPGSVIPSTGAVLKIGEIRGVQSAGMLLSMREMGLGEDHDGIVDLPADAPVGMAYAAYAGLSDPVIEIAVTPNRGDALSVRGVARDLAAAGLGELVAFAPAPVAPGFVGRLGWVIEMPAACPWVLGRMLRGVRNGASPQWLQDRLVSVGLRPINTLVDITNFFTIDLGRPLHVFDAGKVQGDVLSIRPGAGETFRALNGRDYTVRDEDCVIADAAGVQSLAGVIGGEATGCDGATTEVFVECALFDPVRVALSGRHHGVISDARARFERGLDAALLPAAVEAATAMILALCGGEAGDVVAAGAEPGWRREAALRFDRLRDFGGLEVPGDAAVAALGRLGFAVVERRNSAVTVAVPSWRNDVAAAGPLEPWPELDPATAATAAAGRDALEAEADLIEEVLRLQGLDAVPPVSMPPVSISPVSVSPVSVSPGSMPVSTALPQPVLTARQTRVAVARRAIAARGFAECVGFSFMDRGQAGMFGAVPASLRLDNPIAADLDQMRPTPLATLGFAAARNAARGWGEVSLFEIGPGYRETGQVLVAAGLRCGSTARSWVSPAQGFGAMDAKADVWAVLAGLGVPLEALTVTADADGHWHPGQSGVVRQGPKTVLAQFGALHPRVVAAVGMAGPAVGFEIFLDAVAEPKRRRRAAADLPALQPVRRDFAFVVGRAVAADAVLRAARGAERTLIAAVSLFDVYQGSNVGTDEKSLGVEVVFQPREATMTDAEIEAACGRVVAAVGKATGAVLRK